MSSRPDEPTGAIRLTGGDVLTDESVEIARVWITESAGSSVWINAKPLAEPELFGFLLADVFQHAASTYADVHGMSVDAARQAIRAGFDAMAGKAGERGDVSAQRGRLN